jgi:hypothetical protein
VKPRKVWFGLLLLSLPLACGEVERDPRRVLASTAGTAGTIGSAGRGGAAGHETGGAGDVQTPPANAGNGGAAGAAPQLPLGSCEAAPFAATCDENCNVVFAAGLKCGRPLGEVQVADTALLISFQEAPESLFINRPFDFRLGGLVSGDVFDSVSRGALAYDGTQPIVVVETDAGLQALPSGVIIADGGQPLAARSEDGNLYVLGQVRGNAKAKALWVINPAGEIEQRLVYPDAEQLQFVAGMPATSLVVADRSVDSLEAPLWKPDAAIRLLLASQSTLGAVALADEASMSSPALGGVVTVSTATGEMLRRGNQVSSCPGGFVALYPYICESDHDSLLAPTTTTGYVVAATVAYAKDAPWLITLVADVTQECRLTTNGGCFESLPCDCGYRSSLSGLTTALQLTRLDQPATSYRIQLDGVPYSAYASLTASSAGSVADLTITLGPAGAASFGYLLVRLN